MKRAELAPLTEAIRTSPAIRAARTLSLKQDPTAHAGRGGIGLSPVEGEFASPPSYSRRPRLHPTTRKCRELQERRQSFRRARFACNGRGAPARSLTDAGSLESGPVPHQPPLHGAILKRCTPVYSTPGLLWLKEREKRSDTAQEIIAGDAANGFRARSWSHCSYRGSYSGPSFCASWGTL